MQGATPGPSDARQSSPAQVDVESRSQEVKLEQDASKPRARSSWRAQSSLYLFSRLGRSSDHLQLCAYPRGILHNVSLSGLPSDQLSVYSFADSPQTTAPRRADMAQTSYFIGIIYRPSCLPVHR